MLLISVLFGFALVAIGDAGGPLIALFESATKVFFRMIAMIMVLAPIGAAGAVEQLTLLGVAMLTSDGAAGVAGSGFITLAATLAVVPTVPVAGLALILGLDRFMSEARALTNFVGNGVACIAVARWERELDSERMRDVLDGPRN